MNEVNRAYYRKVMHGFCVHLFPDIGEFPISRNIAIMEKGDEMISYDPLWETMKEKKISQYVLINKYNMSRGLIDRLKHNQSVTASTLDMLCQILDCNIEDVITCSREKKE